MAKTLKQIDQEAGKLLRAARKNSGMSQADLAHECEISFQQIQKYEEGHNRISISRLVQMARALQIKPADLLPADA
ncbi:MAG: helix-turn-helix transcriptional regulator [Pseudomonadota bacterium]